MFSDEIICKQLTRIADALERIAYARQRTTEQEPTMPKSHEPLFGPNAFLSETEAAEKLGLSKAWFQHKRVAGGGPPYIKIGSKVRYSARELEAWCRNNTVAHTSEWSSKKDQKRTEF